NHCTGPQTKSWLRPGHAKNPGQNSKEKSVPMIFTETNLKGAFILDLERREDSRGFFARAFCQHEFEAHGLKPLIAQSNVAFNHKKGSLRGMHYQFPPSADTN